MDALRRAVRDYASKHANGDGLALTSVPGLRMMCVHAPSGPLHSIYRPLVCLVLQGAKHMLVGSEERIVSRGDSVVVTADMPVTGRIVQASQAEPYLALAVELDVSLIREIASGLALTADGAGGASKAPAHLVSSIDEVVLDCALRLMRLLGRVEAIPLLHPGIARELHYWLLSGPHGAVLRALALPTSSASRLAAAVAVLRAEYRTRIPVRRLAKSAGMSLTAFHVQFKQLTSLTPVQFQKRLRLMEARRLMVHEGVSATTAAFEVGYESASQFSREYARLFGAPPKRDALRARSAPLPGTSARRQAAISASK
ncbi:AraC family transcriptional regulator [Sorangium sp. So ce1097]|uniref:AraC family transcriptional regulator n=1 Tax=Sorangium sp. So ce1097 TaxID=3133330 RepID=UPI003F5E2B73